MAYRRRGIGDFIPTSGEGRALVEVKGRVGGKGRNMRRGFKKGSKKPYAELKAWTATFDNVNWGLFQPCKISDALDGPGGGAMQRFCHWSAESLGADELGQSIFIKRLRFKAGVHSGIGQGFAVGSRVRFTGSVRDDIPAPGPVFNGVSLDGALLDGNPTGITGTPPLQGVQSWMEGHTLAWFLMYEDQASAGQPLDTAFPDGAGGSNLLARNKTIFWQGQTVSAAYCPTQLVFDKRFPGNGVRIGAGSRDIFQVTLAYQVMNTSGGLGRDLTCAPTEARMDYFDND